MRKTTWFAALLLLAGILCNAQQVIKHGSIEVSFPTSSWIETEPPPQMTALTNINPQLNIVFHGISEPAQLRLHINRIEYPKTADGEVIAGYLSGLRKRCERQARGPIVEKFDTSGKIPTHFFQANLPGDLFLEIRALFCAERVYLLEIGGPTVSRNEAQRCLDKITIDEPGVTGVSAASIDEAERRFGGQRNAYQAGRRAGYLISLSIFLLFVVSGAVALALAIRRAHSRKPPTHPPARPVIPPSILGSTTPPPIPTQANSPNPPQVLP